MQYTDCALVFMTKWPEPGRAKTRLSPPLTPKEAAELARCFLLDMLAAAAETGCDCLLAFAPLSARERFRELAGPDVGLIAAETGSLGSALRQAQAAAFECGYRRVAVVGSDLPHLSAERYLDAFALLGGADVVLGPSGDGGYYLLAAQAPTPALFEGITWSTETVYERTLERATEAGLRVACIASCDDIDTAADLRPLLTALLARRRPSHTLTRLQSLPWLSTQPDDRAVRAGGLEHLERIDDGSESGARRRAAAGTAAG